MTAQRNLPCTSTAATVARRVAVLFFSLGLLVCPPAFAQKWQDLKPDEQKILAPLQPDWQSLADVRKRKWREVAGKYPKMAPDQQKNLQDRMVGWAKLTPDERRKAREQYNELKTLPPEKRAAVTQKWDEYQNLPPEKREELRKKAAEAKAVPPSGGKTVPIIPKIAPTPAATLPAEPKTP